MDKRVWAISNQSLFGSIPRAASFSELPTCRRIVYEESKTSEGLIKQYSCEQLFDENSNLRQIEVSTVYKAGDKPTCADTWNIKFPVIKPSTWGSTGKLMADHINDTNQLSRSLHSLHLNTMKNSEQNNLNNLAPKIKVEPVHSDEDNTTEIEVLAVKKPKKPETFTEENINLVADDSKVINKAVTILKDETTDKPRGNLRPLMPESAAVHFFSPRKCVKFVFISLLIVFSSILLALINQDGAVHFDFTNASIALRKNLYYQEKAVETLIEAFQGLESTNFSTVVLLGGSGVGKSYTASIITDYFPNKYNIFYFYPRTTNLIDIADHSLSSVYCNLVVWENLKLEDVWQAAKFTQYFYTRPKKRMCLTNLLLVNPEVIRSDLSRVVDAEESLKTVNSVFERLQVPVKVVHFQPLTLEAIELCIRNEARRINAELSEKQLLELAQELERSQTGCKRAHAKVHQYLA